MPCLGPCHGSPHKLLPPTALGWLRVMHAQRAGIDRFKRAQYTVTAVVPEDSLGSTARDDIRQTEAKLLEQRAALHAFETEYRQVGHVR